MPTTIDSLQIEIQSNSTSASAGIRDLAKSLGELKSSGTVTTAIKNLDKLSTSLRNFTDASHATRSLGKLVGAMERLKSVGSITSIGNSLNKLGASLKTVGNINIDNVAPKIERIAGALKPLSEVKAGGINTMVNGLSKLGKVTESLDEETIEKFEARIKRLNEVLGPLSQKMNTIQTGLRGINSKARSAGSSVRNMGDDIDHASLNFSTFVNVVQTVVQALQRVIEGFQQVISQAIEWDGIKYQFGNTFGDEADFYYEKITKITDALMINKQVFMENSAMAGSMLIGFGVNDADARKMGLGYTELAYDIWAAFNNVYKTLDGADGAMAAVRSAIAGEVEPIRRAGFTIVEATLAETAAYHGLDISISNATEAQKSYLRYLTLMDQAHRKGIVGAYAREMNTAEGMMRTFSQQLKSLAQAFGSLFLPILVKVMPYVQAFVELLEDGVRWIAGLFGIEIQDIGDTWTDYSSTIEGAQDKTEGVTDALTGAAKAAKELKNATIGIDELNVISPPTSSGSSGSGSGGGAGGAGGFDGLDVDSLWDESIFDTVNQQVDELKGKVKDWLLDIAPLAAGIATVFAGWRLTGLLEDLGTVSPKLLNLTKGITIAGIALSVGKLVWDFTGAYLEGGDEKELLKAFGSTALGAALAYFLAGGGKAGAGGAGFTILVSGVVTITKLGLEIGEGTVDFGDPETWMAGLLGALETAIGGVLTWKVIGPWVTKAWSAIAPELAKHLAGKGGLIGAIVAAIILMVDFLVENLDKVKQAFTEWWDENLGPVFDEIETKWKELVEVLQPVITELEPIFNAIAEWWNGIDWSWLDHVVEFLGGVIFALVSAPITQVLTDIVDAIKNLITWVTGVSKIISGAYDLVVAIFTGGDIEAAWTKIWDGVKDVLSGLWGFISDPIKNLYDGIITWFTKLWDTLVGHSIVPDTVDAIVEWFTGLPGKIFGSIEKFVTGLVDKFKGLWSNLTAWWNSKPSLKTYTPSIGDIKEKLSSAWTTAKNWWNDKKAALKSYTPSIGSIYEKVKDRWDSARTWWNDKKTAMKQYTPNIGSIYEKAKERWDNARTWWNSKKAKMNTYTPSIGSIKDKVVSAWNSAKKWWNSNAKLSTKLNISVPKIEVKWDTATAFGKSFKYPTGFKLKFAADGGIFDQGSLIWAGERGAEVVANAGGGKTGVMNVQQMQDAVYEGVYAAVMAAMRATSGSNGSQSVNVYLDGRQVTAAVEQRQRERGASIMGSQVYSY